MALSKVQINFAERELNWRIYILDEVLLRTKQVQVIDRKKFLSAALATDKEAFVVYMAYWDVKMSIHPI